MLGKRLLWMTYALCAATACPTAAAKIIDFNVTPPIAGFPGAADQDRSGQFVLLGDVDGNGRDDLIIGAPSADFSGRSNCGTIFIYLSVGAAPSGTIELGGANPNLRRIQGAAASNAIGSVMAVGDVNNDDRADILIGVPGATVNGRTQAGQVFVILGSVNPPAELDLASPSALVIQIQGAEIFHKLGTSVAVGNVDDDDFGDIIMGAPFATTPAGAFAGKVFVLPGATSLADTIDLATPPVNVKVLNGAKTNDTFGTACYAADVNDDTIDDIIAGSPQASPLGRSSAGISYIVPGSGSLASTINVGDGAAAAIVQIFGAVANGLAGSRFSAADLNGDGVDDLLVGAPEMTTLGRAAAGAVFVLGGTNAWPDTVDLAGGGLTRIDGPAANLKIGLRMQAGDLNMDGYDDLVLGVPLMTPFVGRDQAGVTFCVFGRETFAANVDLATNATGLTKIFGAKKNDNTGRSVAVGNIDGGPFADLLIGADNVPTANGAAVGESYVVYGSAAITPTQVTFYNAFATANGVDVEWILADDVATDLFEVWREVDGRVIRLAQEDIVRSAESHYRLRDTDVRPGGTYLYTVSVTGSESQLLFVATVRVPTAQSALRLRARPNPTRSTANIEFELPDAGHATVAVYDVRGARVATLADATFAAGTGTTSWDGRTQNGGAASSGVYFVRLEFGGRHEFRKLLVVR